MQRYAARLMLGVALILGAGALSTVWAQQAPLAFASGTCPAAGVTLSAATETVAVSTPGITTKGAQTVRLFGEAVITTAASTTAIELQIRRGTTASGTAVGAPQAVAASASASANFTYATEDTPGEVAGQRYTLTAQATGPTLNGTIVSCELWVLVY